MKITDEQATEALLTLITYYRQEGQVQQEKQDALHDPVHHPSHYSWRGGMEAADIAAEMTRGTEGVEAYWIGCTIKYLYRYPKKNGLQDIDKAIECLKLLRKVLSKKVQKNANSLE